MVDPHHVAHWYPTAAYLYVLWLDTLALGKMCVPGLPDYSLSTLCDSLGLTPSVDALLPGRRWHDALYDALGSLLVVRFLVRELKLSSQPLEVLGRALGK